MALKPALKTPPESPLLRALAGQAQAVPPFWLMRQAGRYLPEYRALRARAGSFLDLCYNPALAAEATLQPLRRFGMDAAILFSDILVVPHGLGRDLRFAEGEGPRLAPLSEMAEVEALDLAGMTERLSPVYETVSCLRGRLPDGAALIGFAGAPWTLACYMLQGRGGGDFEVARVFMHRRPEIFRRLIDVLTQATILHLSAQIAAGAQAVQIFDSWAGLLPAADFMEFSALPARRIVAALRDRHPGVPVIGFPRGAGALYPAYARISGVDGLGLDTAAPLEQDVPETLCLQGNLDPAALLAGGAALETQARRILSAMRGRPFIFNLGHGVIKETPPEHVARLAEIVRGA